MAAVTMETLLGSHIVYILDSCCQKRERSLRYKNSLTVSVTYGNTRILREVTVRLNP